VDAANPFSYLCRVFDYMHEGILAGPVQSIDVWLPTSECCGHLSRYIVTLPYCFNTRNLNHICTSHSYTSWYSAYIIQGEIIKTHITLRLGVLLPLMQNLKHQNITLLITRRGNMMIMTTDHYLSGVLNVIDLHFIIDSPLTLKMRTS
jgi:hypothetical protein